MKNMLSAALCEIRGLLNQLFINLEGEQGLEWLSEFKKFLRKEACWADCQTAKVVSAATSALLNFIDIVEIDATTEKFIAKDKFVVDTGRKAKVKISCVWDNFMDNFLDKVEDPIEKSTLRYAKLMKDSVDKPIIEESGGKDKVETTLTKMFSLMEKQGNGEDGVLLTNGYANIFYIRDAKGVLWAVLCRWGVLGWYVRAFSVESPGRWDAGCRVFSRNSSEPQG